MHVHNNTVHVFLIVVEKLYCSILVSRCADKDQEEKRRPKYHMHKIINIFYLWCQVPK